MLGRRAWGVYCSPSTLYVLLCCAVVVCCGVVVLWCGVWNGGVCGLVVRSPLLFVFLFLFVLVFGVVRAQLCEHARSTTRALVFWFVYLMYCVLLLPHTVFVVPTHTLFIVNDRHAHH